MRNISLAIVAAAAAFATGGAVTPAKAQDTYCLQGRSYGYPGNCQFSTYQQCQATASGTDSACGLNPRRSYVQRQRGGFYER